MTFNQAYKIAMEKSATFRKHDLRVKEAMETGTATPCLIFTVEPHASFYYGFDGVDIQRGKHTRKRAMALNDRDEVLFIL